MSFKEVNLSYLTSIEKENVEVNVDNNKIYDEIYNEYNESGENGDNRNNEKITNNLTKDIKINVEVFPHNDLEKLSEKKINVFINDIIPYIGGSSLNKITDFINNPSNISPASLVSQGKGVYDALTDLSHLTFGEIALLYSSNFYSVMFKRGIKVKQKTGFDGLAEPYDGKINLDFGKEIKNEFISMVSKIFEGKFEGDPNVDIQKEKERKKVQIPVFPPNKFSKQEKIINLRREEEKKEETIIDLEKYSGKEKLKDEIEKTVKSRQFLTKKNNWQLGSIYVMPISEGTELNNFFIPFEFNPDIQEGGMAANYQATTVLSRIGGLYTFLGTNSNTVTLNTKYIVLHNPDVEYNKENNNSWMIEATPENIQAIELAYRSLTLPSFPNKESQDPNSYKYIKPPLIRVIMGDENNNSKLYSNLLTYQNKTVYKDKLKSIDGDNKLYKTFIVTNVTIKKDINNDSLILNDEGVIMDTFGFEVSLNMTEVTPSYMDQVPDFKSYYDGYMNVYDKRLKE